FWEDPTEHDAPEDVERMQMQGYKDEFDNQSLSVKGFLKFETCYLRCIISLNNKDSIKYLHTVNQSKPYEEADGIKAERKLLCVWGTVERTTLFEDVAEEGKELGTKPELIIINVDKVERPDDIFFKEIYKQEEEEEDER
ncbi:MAG: hypothetical protein ABIH42_00135, partial [Planctomycetota bacterium]